MAIYVAFEGPLDQHFMRHPEDLFGRPIENAQVGWGRWPRPAHTLEPALPASPQREHK